VGNIEDVTLYSGRQLSNSLVDFGFAAGGNDDRCVSRSRDVNLPLVCRSSFRRSTFLRRWLDLHAPEASVICASAMWGVLTTELLAPALRQLRKNWPHLLVSFVQNTSEGFF
jgi:hypothetical protein